MQCDAVFCSVLQCVVDAVGRGLKCVLRCVAVCCSVLQCVVVIVEESEREV